DQDRLYLWCVQRRRQFVIQQRGNLVAPLTEYLLLHHRLAVAHVAAAFDLSSDEQRIDRASHIMRQPELFYGQLSRLDIYRDLGHASRVGVGGRWANARPFVIPMNVIGWSVGTRGDESTKTRLCKLYSLHKGQRYARVIFVVNLPISGLQ